MMDIELTLNGVAQRITCDPGDSLLTVLRRLGCFSVRYGSETGETGAAAVLVDGRLLAADVLLAAQAGGHQVTTVESLDVATGELHPIQAAFVESGALQSGYSAGAMVLATQALLGAGARSDGGGDPRRPLRDPRPGDRLPEGGGRGAARRGAAAGGEARADGAGRSSNPSPTREPGPGPDAPAAMPRLVPSADVPPTHVVGRPVHKVDAVKLVKGNPAFVDDVELRGMLYAKVLRSPHAHARILAIDDTEARALPGVHAVLHAFNTPRVKYASGGQSWPNPAPWDQVSFDDKVRHVGDRVAAVAAETLRDRRGGLPADHGDLRGAAGRLRRGRGHRPRRSRHPRRVRHRGHPRRGPQHHPPHRGPDGPRRPARRGVRRGRARLRARPSTSSSSSSARSSRTSRSAGSTTTSGWCCAPRPRCPSTSAGWSRRCSACRSRRSAWSSRASAVGSAASRRCCSRTSWATSCWPPAGRSGWSSPARRSSSRRGSGTRRPSPSAARSTATAACSPRTCAWSATPAPTPRTASPCSRSPGSAGCRSTTARRSGTPPTSRTRTVPWPAPSEGTAPRRRSSPSSRTWTTSRAGSASTPSSCGGRTGCAPATRSTSSRSSASGVPRRSRAICRG